MASGAVAEGLRARLSYLEAAGWLRCAHMWIHPRDLALRDNVLTGSYAAAAMAADRLPAALPATAMQEGEFEVAPSDMLVNNALQLARSWRRIAELRSWRPLADAGSLQEALRAISCGTLDKAEIADWLGVIRALDRGPVLIRAGAPRAIGSTDRLSSFIIRRRISWRRACGGRKPRTDRSPSPSGQRPSFIITGSVCASDSSGWRNFSIARRQQP
jgi:hypothetical protein